MARIIQAQAADSLDVVPRKRSKEKANISYLISYSGRAENIAFDDSGGFGFGDVGDAFGEDGVPIVRMAITGEEAYESLESHQSVSSGVSVVLVLTEKAAMLDSLPGAGMKGRLR